MRVLAAAMTMLLLATFAKGECVTVQSPLLETPSQEFRISAVTDKKALQNADIQIFSNGKSMFSGKTDKVGLILVPPLPVGFYQVVATATGELRAEVSLVVSGSAAKQTAPFLLNLVVPPKPLTPFQLLSRTAETAQAKPPENKLQEFKGTVIDPSGAVTPEALIAIFPKGFRSESEMLEMKADENGRFSKTLKPGIYTAVFQLLGFRTTTLVFEIATDGSAKDLQVLLKLGAAC